MVLLGVIILIVLIYVLPYRILLFGPFTISEMDFNNDGFLSTTEAIYHADYGKRQITVDGKNCIEYYAQKDGIELKVICE